MYDLTNELNIVFIAFAVILGLIFGSFATMAVHRIPNKEDMIFKRSYCPKCYQVLGVKDLIPVFSWLINSGRCRYCHNKIHIRYIFIEIFTGAAFGLIYIIFGLSFLSLIGFLIMTLIIIIFITVFNNKVKRK